MTYHPLSSETLRALDPIFQDIQATWDAWNATVDADAVFSEWKEGIRQGTISGMLYADEKDPKRGIAVIWQEKTGPNYSNVLIHSTEDIDPTPLIKEFFNRIDMSTFIAELIQYTDSFVYRDAFIALGCFEKERQRMSVQIPDDIQAPTLSSGLSLAPADASRIPDIATVSCAAHYPRKGVEGYIEFSTPEERIKLSEQFRNHPDVPFLEAASELLYMNGQPAAAIELMRYPWQPDEDSAWIMDITVDPDHQGQGLAYRLLQDSMYKVKTLEKINHMGLSVTLSNHSAISLYEQMGFEPYQIFVEIISSQCMQRCIRASD